MFSAKIWFMKTSSRTLMQMASDKPLYFWPSAKKSDSSTQTIREPPTTSKTPVNGNQGNVATVKILEASLSQSTHSKYNIYIKHWVAYSKTKRKIEVTRVFLFMRFCKCYV